MTIHPLLPELTRLQRRDRYLAPDALEELSKRLAIPVNQIISVASFYQAFRFKPCGKHRINVCVGAACYVKGAEKLYDAFADYLELAPGEDTSADGLFTLGKVACLGCCMLAVAVQIDRHIFGHVTPDDIPRILDEFLQMAGGDEASQSGAATDGAAAEIRVCRCSSCRAAGSDRIFEALVRACRDERLPVTVKEVGCHGMSYRAPIVSVALPDAVYHYDRVRETDVYALLNNHFKPVGGFRRISWESKRFLDRFYSRQACSCSATTPMDGLVNATRLVTRNSGISSPESIDDYRRGGGLLAFEKASALEPEAVISLLTQAKLRGRGGGGFPTGEKWRLAYEAPGDRKVVICNADEGDPGAFMDRMLLESYPYRVLEGILIAAKTIRAECAIIYIREEYAQAIAVLERVIGQLREHGLFKAVSPGFEIILFRGAGAFVCGEETALLESIEGRRGIPRQRPPFPVEHGLNGLPTLMNNVETFACVPVILADGGKAFTAVGTERSHGTKAFALAGKVKQGGLIEVPIGISVGDVVETFGGGAEEGHAIKAVMIGGPSGGCIARRNFDLPVDYESLRQSGAMMGSGGLIVIDERDCLVDLSLYFLQFLRDESCGKCTPCREGVLQLCEWVESLTKSAPKPPDILERIEELARQIQQGSLCALGRTAPNMVLSALHEFRQEFEAHLQGSCPAGKCRELTEFEITDACIGCTKCAQVCAADAITSRRSPFRLRHPSRKRGKWTRKAIRWTARSVRLNRAGRSWMSFPISLRCATSGASTKPPAAWSAQSGTRRSAASSPVARRGSSADTSTRAAGIAWTPSGEPCSVCCSSGTISAAAPVPPRLRAGCWKGSRRIAPEGREADMSRRRPLSRAIWSTRAGSACCATGASPFRRDGFPSTTAASAPSSRPRPRAGTICRRPWPRRSAARVRPAH